MKCLKMRNINSSFFKPFQKVEVRKKHYKALLLKIEGKALSGETISLLISLLGQW